MKLFLNGKKAAEYCRDRREKAFADIPYSTVSWYTGEIHDKKEKVRLFFYFILLALGASVCLFAPPSSGFSVLSRNNRLFALGMFPVVLLLQLLLHEIIHALCLPHPFAKNSVAIFFGGPNPYVCSFRRLTKKRYLFFISFPFLSMTVASVVAMMFLGGFDKYLFIMILFNFSYSDTANFIIVSKSVPDNAVLVGNEYFTVDKRRRKPREKTPIGR